MDESVLKLGGTLVYLWLARDPDSGETLSFVCSFAVSPEDSATSARSVLSTRSDRLAVRVERGPSRPRAMKSLDLYFETEGTSGVVQTIQRVFRVGSR